MEICAILFERIGRSREISTLQDSCNPRLTALTLTTDLSRRTINCRNSIVRCRCSLLQPTFCPLPRSPSYTIASNIINIFVNKSDPGYETVALLATQFLAIAAIFQVFDGLQAIAARALRGVKDNYAPLWIATFGYWVLGIGGGAFLAFGLGFDGAGLWWGLAIGLFVTGTLLAVRFWRLTNRLIRGGA